MTFSVGDRVLVMGDCESILPAELWVEGTVIDAHENGRWLRIDCDRLPIPGIEVSGHWWCGIELLRLVDITPEYLEARRKENIKRMVNRPPAKRYGPYKPIMRALP